MKISRLLLATCLALAAVVVVVGALAWGHASTVQADEAVTAPAAPQTLPMPWLSDDDVADAPYGFSPTVDGRITPGEYAGAGKITFPGYAGDVEVFLRQDAITGHGSNRGPGKWQVVVLMHGSIGLETLARIIHELVSILQNMNV